MDQMLCKKSFILVLEPGVVLVEDLTRNVITNCMKLFLILTSSSGEDVYNISYLEL